MFSKTTFARTLMAAGLVVGLAGGAQAAATQSHDGHAGHAMEMKLDNGKKWQTDEALRKGMGEIRKEMAAALPSIHENKHTPAQYDALAAKVEKQIEYVTENCKLSEAADEQLHVVLAQVIEGIEGMKGKAERRGSAVKVIQALDAYGKHFDHAGWKSFKH